MGRGWVCISDPWLLDQLLNTIPQAVHPCPHLHIAWSRLGLLVGRKVLWEEETQVRLLEAVGGCGEALEGGRHWSPFCSASTSDGD